MKKIACTIMAGIGDSILITPAFEKIKESFPNSRLTMIVNSNAIKDILKTNPYINNFYVINPRPKTMGDKIKFWLKYKNWKKILHLRKQKFDILYCFSKGIQEKIFTNILNPKKNKLYKDVSGERIKNNIFLVNEKKEDGFPEIFLDREEKEESKKIKKEFKSKKLIGIHPGCGRGSEFKRWPIKNFVKLADNLREKGFRCMFFLGPDEEILEKEITKSKYNHSIIKKKNIRESLVHINACDLFVSNDSGIMHLANGLNKKIIAIINKEERVKDLKNFNLKNGKEKDINSSVGEIIGEIR
jgi:heptosyltransferase II